MLYFIGRESSYQGFNNTGLAKTAPVLCTANAELYKALRMKKIFSGVLSGIPNKTFGFAYIENHVLTNETLLLKLANIVNGGLVFQYTIPWAFENFFYQVSRFKETLEKEEKVRQQREQLKAQYDKDRENYKVLKKEVEEQNELLKAQYEKALEEAPESVKAFIQEPKWAETPKKPEEPKYPEFEKGYSIHNERLDRTLPWRVLMNFELIEIKGTNLGLFKKRTERLDFNGKNVLSLKIGQMTSEEFETFFKKEDIDIQKKIEEIKQSFFDVDSIEIVAKTDFTIKEMMFSEEQNELEEFILPPLAPIKPMHAASMLAGGVGGYSKEMILKGERVLLKAATVKEFKTRKTVYDGKEVEEVIELYEEKLGIYNLDRRDLRLIS